ncbi:MAG: hypothetical protein ACI4CT_03440 [Lachnospiraceae bacterium]
MSNLIVCMRNPAKKGFTFEDTGVTIYSYEELCYYINQNRALFVEDWFTVSLRHWITKELQLEEMLRLMNGYSDNSYLQIRALLDYGSYYERYAVDEIVEELQRLQKGSRIQFQKKKADCYLHYQKYFRARQEYNALLMQKHLIPDRILLGNIYHNKGLTYLMDMDIIGGKECLEEAYRNNRSMATFYTYLILCYLEGDIAKVKAAVTEMGLPDQVYYDFKEHYLNDTGGSYHADADLLNKAFYDKEHGRKVDYEYKIDRLLDIWKKDYRRQTN